MPRTPARRRPSFVTGRTVQISTLVTALAGLSALSGCSTSSPRQDFTNYSVPAQDTPEQRAAMADAIIDESRMQGAFTTEEYYTDAAGVQLPHEWLTEAWNATADHQARRASAQAESVRIRSNEDSSFGVADFEMQGFMSRHEIELAEAQKLEGVFDAKLQELDAHADAQDMANAAEQSRQQSLLDAAVLEWNSEVEKLSAEGQSAWASAQAEYERMLVERSSVEQRGNSEVQRMRRLAELTEARAAAQVAQLRQDARTTTEQTTARVEELRQQVQTTTDQTAARVADLRQQSRSASTQGQAHSSEMRARAVAIEEQDVDETFRLMMSAAEARFTQAQAESERLFSEADALENNLGAEMTRRFADAEQGLEIDRTDFEEAVKSIESFVEHGRAEVALKRVRAMTIEKSARAEFVKAEATARANALRETAEHQFELAEAEQERLEAEARAEAARVEAAYFAMLAEQAKKGSVERPGATNRETPGANANDANPEFAEAAPKAERVDPKHVAAFKAGLSSAQSMRKTADAEELALFATAQERQRSFEAWFDQREASFEESVAEADRFGRQTQAKINHFVAQAESMLQNATAELGRAQMTAEAERRDALASIQTMRADAVATDKKTVALKTQLTAEADATERNGASQVRSLNVILASTQQRGQAEAARMFAQADALEEDQRAVVAQMNQEIRSTERSLRAELAMLDQQAQSFFQVADASFQENRAIITAMGEINDATFEQLAAANEANARIDQAEVAYLRDLNLANQLVAEAAVERVMANADADLNVARSYDFAQRASIDAGSAIAEASVREQWAIAGANEQTTRALFDSRIVSTLAQRNSDYADLYQQNQQSRMRLQQAMASAAAYEELSRRAMTNFAERSEDFTVAAQQNWYSQLANPAPFGAPENAQNLNAEAEALFNGAIVNVPIED